MTDADFIAAMAVGIPPITPPTLKADSTGLIRGLGGESDQVTTWIVPLPTTSTDGAPATQEQSPMTQLKAFYVDDMPTIYAAATAEEAARLYEFDLGEPCEEGYPYLVTDAELDKPVPETDGDEQPTGVMTTMRAWLGQPRRAQRARHHRTQGAARMTTDKTLADAKPGGCVQLGGGLPDLPDPWYRPHSSNAPFDQILYSEGQMRDYARAALSAQPSPGGQGDVDMRALAASIGEVAHRLSTYMPHLSEWADRARDCKKAADVLAALAARQPVGERVDDDWHLRGYAYASKQATTCAGCGKHKHTPLRIDAMGGHVCLTCIDQKLGALLGEFGCPPAHAVDLPYPLDADPAGIRARVADVITGTLMVGAQGHTPPPAGHWAEPFWQAARADAVAQAVDLDAARHEGHDCAIRYVLGYLNGTGDLASTQYGEILNGCGRESIIRSAIRDGELEFTGLGRWVAKYGTDAERALIDSQAVGNGR